MFLMHIQKHVQVHLLLKPDEKGHAHLTCCNLMRFNQLHDSGVLSFLQRFHERLKLGTRKKKSVSNTDGVVWVPTFMLEFPRQ